MWYLNNESSPVFEEGSICIITIKKKSRLRLSKPVSSQHVGDKKSVELHVEVSKHTNLEHVTLLICNHDSASPLNARHLGGKLEVLHRCSFILIENIISFVYFFQPVIFAAFLSKITVEYELTFKYESISNVE